MEIRLAVVQRGDYLRSRQGMERGDAETFMGMRESVDALKQLLDPHPHCVINVGASRDRSLIRGAQSHHYVEIPHLPRFIPERIGYYVAALKVIRHLWRFRPTHVLLRDDSLIGFYAAHYVQWQRIPALVVFSGAISTVNAWERNLAKRYMRVLNGGTFQCVANFRQAATESLVACGLNPSKASDYEFAVRDKPTDHPVRRLEGERPLRLFCSAPATGQQALLELVEVVIRLSDEGIALHLDLLGDGADFRKLRNLSDVAPPGLVTLHGRVGRETEQALLRNADLVCAVSQGGVDASMMFASEAFALRIPLLAADDSNLGKYFQHGEGVCFYQSGDVDDLALKIQQIAVNPRLYQSLSRTTANAFERIVCRTTFADLLKAWGLTLVRDARKAEMRERASRLTPRDAAVRG